MSVFSDGRTIIGDGSSTDPKLNLATASVDTIATMQLYDGMATVIQVADPYQGGTFHYSDEDSFISGSLTFDGATITLPSTHPGFFKVGQTVYLTGTSTPNYDGEYLITAFDGTVITVDSPAFLTETHAATISIVPFQNIFTFSYLPGTVTIFNSDYATSPSMGFLANGFYAGQSITVTHTLNFNGTFTIATVTEDTITATVSSSFPANEIAVAILTDNSTHAASLKFNSGGTAPTTINDDSGDGLYTHFHTNQNIQVSGTSLNNGVYKVSIVSKSGSGSTITSQLVISSAFKTNDTQTATVSSADGGLTFPAIGKSLGMWRRQYDPKDGLNVTWFGAKGNALRKFSGRWYSSYINPTNNTPANDDTQSIQRALNVAASIRLAINKVVIPPGMYLHRTLYVPAGVLLTGTGAIVESIGIATSRLVMKPGGRDSLRFISTGVAHATTSRRFWYGGVTNLEFLGEPANPTGWAISFSDPTINNPTDSIAPQDMNFFENLMMRGYPEGGMNFPDCAVPLNVRNIKSMVHGGPAILIANTKVSSGQSINLDNVSCDHNVGGGIWLDKLDYRANVVITNLKSEGGASNAFPGYPNAQPNALICTDCSDTPIFINGASHQNVTLDLGEIAGNPTLTLDVAPNPNRIIVNLPGHNLSLNDAVKFITTGALPSVITWLQAYYVIPITGDNDRFMISSTKSGTPLSKIESSLVSSGIHTLYKGFRVDTPPPLEYMAPGELISIETKLANPPVFDIDNSLISIAGSTLTDGDTIKFYTDGVLPGNIIAGQIYKVSTSGVPAGSFKVILSLSTDVVIKLIGTQSGNHRVYKQVNSGDMPRISFVASTIRVRDKDHPDPETTPVRMIAKTAIPYKTTDGSFNVTRELYKDTATVGNGSSVNYANSSTVTFGNSSVANFESGNVANFKNGSVVNMQSGNTTNFKGGSVTNFESGSTLNLQSGSTTGFKGGSVTNFESGSALNLQSGSTTSFKGGSVTNFESVSALNLQSGSITNFKSGSSEVFDTGAAGIELYNTADQVTNFEQAFVNYASNIFQVGTLAGGTRPARPLRLSSSTAEPTKSTAALTINRAAGPLFLFDVSSAGVTGSTKFTPFTQFKAGMSNDALLYTMQLFHEIAPTILQTSTSGYTALLVNVTETTVGSGDKRLIAAKVGGTDKFIVDNTGTTIVGGDVKINTAGKGIYIKEGTNATMGVGTLTSGSLTITTSKVTVNSRIFLTVQEGNVSNLGVLYIQARTAGTSFTVKSSNTADTCTFSWLIVEPA